MSEGRNTELVSELRACATGKTEENPYQMLDRAADALESTSRALSEKEGELAALRSDEAFCCDAVIDQTASEIAGLVGPNDEAQAVEASVKRALVFMRSLANLRLTEALAALKASEERGERLSTELASARLRPEPSGVENQDDGSKCGFPFCSCAKRGVCAHAAPEDRTDG